VQYEVAVNLSSLALVSTELAATLDQAIDTFEEYLSDQDNNNLLANCVGMVWQVAGTLTLIEVNGAALLAGNMHSLLDDSLKSSKPLNDKQLEALSTSFFVLPRYLESVAARKTDNVLMLLPQINELRLSHQREILFEHTLLGVEDQQFSSTSDFGVKQHLDELSAPDTIKRLRHMYQIGLLGVIRESQLELHLRLMTRALQRVSGLVDPGPAQRFWLLASAVLYGFQEKSLSINSTRRRLFGMLDKALRGLSTKQDQIDLVPDMPGLEQELYYLLRISSPKAGTAVARFMAGAGIEPLPLRDIELQSEMQRMLGPGLDAMATVSKELRSELHNAMDILEILMQSGRTDAEEIQPLQAILLQLAGVLKVLSLPTLANYLAAQADAAGKLVSAGHTQAQEQLPNIADAILFIEHSFDKMDRNQLTAAELEDLTPERQMAISNSSQLETSRLLVFKEAEAVISMSKRAITSYLESEYDIAHIYNVGSTLDTIRGAFQLLKMERITLVLQAAVRFINDFTEKTASHSGGKAQELLETLADALISIEYYVLQLSRQEQADDDVLALAEDSLAALGYRVQAKTAA
jgi:hypothetical protein